MKTYCTPGALYRPVGNIQQGGLSFIFFFNIELFHKFQVGQASSLTPFENMDFGGLNTQKRAPSPPYIIFLFNNGR
jgi:hypothetical protein